MRFKIQGGMEMVSQVSPINQQTAFPNADSFPGQKMENSQELPRIVVDRKNETPSSREEIPREEVEKVLDKLNRLMGLIDKRLEFSIHDKSHKVMVKIIDKETGEVINEIPPKKVLDMLSSITDIVGVLVDKRA
jgi:flagellar protein FlaG